MMVNSNLKSSETIIITPKIWKKQGHVHNKYVISLNLLIFMYFLYMSMLLPTWGNANLSHGVTIILQIRPDIIVIAVYSF